MPAVNLRKTQASALKCPVKPCAFQEAGEEVDSSARIVTHRLGSVSIPLNVLVSRVNLHTNEPSGQLRAAGYFNFDL